MSEIVLKTQNLTKHYGNLTAVDDLNLEIYKGEVFGFLGPNGAGKTTAIKMFCGLLKPDAGQVYIHGELISKAGDDIRSRVGVCPQEIVLWERLTCIEQLQFIGQMYGVSGKIARERGDSLLDGLDLLDKRNKLARTLSGGMQRRLNLAMALVHDPEIVVLDEPEAGLDPQSRVKVREYIQSLARVKTVILTTHNMDEADRVADRVAIIDHGKLMVLDSPDVLKGQVGEGDVIEIRVGNLELGDESNIKNSISNLVQEILVDANQNILSFRTLNAVRILPIILEELESIGLQPTDMRIRENTLEDVFIQLTGRSLRE
jgi:ABC-2 type transport system ATP-binding protein